VGDCLIRLRVLARIGMGGSEYKQYCAKATPASPTLATVNDAAVRLQ